jgi:hypothetical protein
MKTTFALSIIGLLLSFITIGTSIEYSGFGFHAEPYLSFSLISAILVLTSITLLGVAFVRLFSLMTPIELCAYDAESLAQPNPHLSHVPFYIHLVPSSIDAIA